MNITRLAIMVVMINFVISLGMEMYQNPITGSTNSAYSAIGEYERATEAVYDEDNVYTKAPSSDVIDEQTIGNQMSWGKSIWTILWKGAIPGTVTGTIWGNPELRFLGMIIDTFRLIMDMIVGIMMYHFFKNKGSQA